MSAIFGVVGAASAAQLKTMGERLAHRGGVASSEEVAAGVHLGVAGAERRAACFRNGLAAVVDLCPLLDRDSCEAEITDALAGAHMQRLQGISHAFAAAAWDDRTQSLLLARDFVGQKPLHFCPMPGGGVAFATELKALLALPGVPAEADLNVIQYLQCYKTTPAGRTPLRHVFTAPPGAVIRLDRDGRVVAREQMPILRVAVQPADEGAVREELARRYFDVLRPLVANAPRVAVSLSGGIDSLSIAFATRHCAPQAELVGYTAGHGPDDPEIRTAALAMARLGGRHEPVIVTSGMLEELLPAAVWHFEAPIGRTETIQMLEVGRAARRSGFEWLLSGIGSDALFAGMPKHKLLWLSAALRPLRKDLHEFYELTQSGLPPRRPMARLMDLLYFRGSVPPVPRVNGSGWAPQLPSFPDAGPEFLNHVLAHNTHESLSRSLVRLERPLQAWGVDMVSPFFDRGLMEYAFSIPSRLKIRRGRDKYVLRQALRSIVPPELLRVPKGIARLRHDRAFAEVLQSLADRWLESREASHRGWFAREDVHRIRRSLRGRRYHPEAAMRLWTLIVTELWATIYVDGRGEYPAEGSAAPARRTYPRKPALTSY